jgi:hypothetical protein
MDEVEIEWIDVPLITEHQVSKSEMRYEEVSEDVEQREETDNEVAVMQNELEPGGLIFL